MCTSYVGHSPPGRIRTHPFVNVRAYHTCRDGWTATRTSWTTAAPGLCGNSPASEATPSSWVSTPVECFLDHGGLPVIVATAWCRSGPTRTCSVKCRRARTRRRLQRSSTGWSGSWTPTATTFSGQQRGVVGTAYERKLSHVTNAEAGRGLVLKSL